MIKNDQQKGATIQQQANHWQGLAVSLAQKGGESWANTILADIAQYADLVAETAIYEVTALIVSLESAADLLRLSPERAAALQEQGVLTRLPAGRFFLPELLAYLRARSS
jgi:hypothetical protein